MKPGLQRIATTLEYLEQEQPTSPKLPQSSEKRQNPSFSIQVKPYQSPSPSVKMPSLPKVKSPNISNHHHGANPALATTLLKEIEEVVSSWQTELQDVVRQIQDLYLEGPIVDGWLESNPHHTDTEHEALRKAEGESLRGYIEEFSQANISYQTPRVGYHLCGLNPDGKLWSTPCPPDQLPNVSVAIARYQKLRQLLNRKHKLETRLQDLSETLVMIHGSLKHYQ
ncbi:MAG: hypothetical protein ACOC0N_05215 [Chroococcales cyanobacterium]